MKVILLAAGYGTRLYPLTKDKPKALLTINGSTILDHILKDIEDYDCCLVTNNKFYEHFTAHANNTYTVLNDNTTSNDDRLGAVGDIVYTINTYNINEDVVIINTDNMFGFDIKTFIEYAQSQAYSLAACKNMEDINIVRNRFGVVAAEHNIITQFQEKPSEPISALASVGLYYIKQHDIVHIKQCADLSADNTGDMIQYLVNNSTVGVWTFTDEWSDVGTHESLEKAKTQF